MRRTKSINERRRRWLVGSVGRRRASLKMSYPRHGKRRTVWPVCWSRKFGNCDCSHCSARRGKRKCQTHAGELHKGACKLRVSMSVQRCFASPRLARHCTDCVAHSFSKSMNPQQKKIALKLFHTSKIFVLLCRSVPADCLFLNQRKRPDVTRLICWNRTALKH
jgi:hypothetical protein